MSTKLRAAIVGSTGYGGVELIRLLLAHPHVAITSVISSSNAGASIADGYPHLNQILTDKLDAVDVDLIREKADVVFLATPHGVSTELSPKLIDAGLKVIDISGDFRLKSGRDYEAWYKHKAADPAISQRRFTDWPRSSPMRYGGLSLFRTPAVTRPPRCWGWLRLQRAVGWIRNPSLRMRNRACRERAAAQSDGSLFGN